MRTMRQDNNLKTRMLETEIAFLRNEPIWDYSDFQCKGTDGQEHAMGQAGRTLRCCLGPAGGWLTASMPGRRLRVILTAG